MMNRGEYMTLKEAARQIGRHPSTLRHAILRKTLAAEMIGRDYFVTQDALDTYVASAAHHRPDLWKRSEDA
jgi:excisionase family DNA binding protein